MQAVSNRMAWPLISTWSLCKCTLVMLSMRSGVSDKDTRVAILSPTFRSIFPASAASTATVPIGVPHPIP